MKKKKQRLLLSSGSRQVSPLETFLYTHDSFYYVAVSILVIATLGIIGKNVYFSTSFFTDSSSSHRASSFSSSTENMNSDDDKFLNQYQSFQHSQKLQRMEEDEKENNYNREKEIDVTIEKLSESDERAVREFYRTRFASSSSSSSSFRNYQPPRECMDEFDRKFVEEFLGAAPPLPSSSMMIAPKLIKLFKSPTRDSFNSIDDSVINSTAFVTSAHHQKETNITNTSAASFLLSLDDLRKQVIKKKRIAFHQAQQEFSTKERNILFTPPVLANANKYHSQNNNSSSSGQAALSSLTEKFFEGVLTNGNNNMNNKNTSSSSPRKYAASSFYRLIPRSDSGSGQETFAFMNLTAEQCAKRCFSVGPHYCTFFTREVKPMAHHIFLSDRQLHRYTKMVERRQQQQQQKSNRTSSLRSSLSSSLMTLPPGKILHPYQAREDFLFTTFEEELERRSVTNTVCTLRVGIVEPFPDRRKELWVPSWVAESTSLFVSPGRLSKKTGRYSGCKVVGNNIDKNQARKQIVRSNEKRRQRQKYSKVSSLMAIGVLAGSMHLKERLFPALSTWLKDEPNVVAFVDRKRKAMRTIRNHLRIQQQQQQQQSGTQQDEVDSGRSNNPLFACLHLSSLLGLYREYPQAGGDAVAGFSTSSSNTAKSKNKKQLHDHDWDEELMSIFGVSKQSSKNNETSLSNTLSLPFFCNPSENDNDGDNGDVHHHQVAGINFPVPTPSLLNLPAAADVNQHKRSNTNKGTTLFRFIREPYHRTLRKFNGAWKNFIVLYELPLFYPTVNWYFTVDDDAIVMFESLRYLLLLASISNLHKRTDVYGGFVEYGDNMFFAHGGGGMLISSGTMWGSPIAENYYYGSDAPSPAPPPPSSSTSNNIHHYYESPDHAGFHERLPSCLSLCRQAYGDVRVACCMHSIDVYERKFRFLFPFALEKSPEKYSSLLASLHRYQSVKNITTMYQTIKGEMKRRYKAMQLEERHAETASRNMKRKIFMMSNGNNDKNSNTSSIGLPQNNSTHNNNKARQQWRDEDAYRKKFFQLRKSVFEGTRRHRRMTSDDKDKDNGHHHQDENDESPTTIYDNNIALFDEIIFNAELWRHSKSPRKVKVLM